MKLAEIVALHGDLDAARNLLDTVESAAADHPYAIVTWATWASKIAAMAGDPAWTLRAAQRGVDADPEFTFAFLGTYTAEPVLGASHEQRRPGRPCSRGAGPRRGLASQSAQGRDNHLLRTARPLLPEPVERAPIRTWGQSAVRPWNSRPCC